MGFFEYIGRLLRGESKDLPSLSVTAVPASRSASRPTPSRPSAASTTRRSASSSSSSDGGSIAWGGHSDTGSSCDGGGGDGGGD